MDTALAWSRAGKGRLIVENGVTVIVQKAIQFRTDPKGQTPEVTEVPSVAKVPEKRSFADLREAAKALADARPDDSYGVIVEVLHRMYPNEEGSLLRSVAASVRANEVLGLVPEVGPVLPEPVVSEAPPIPELVPEVNVAHMPNPPPNTSKKPYPKRFSEHLAESAVDARMEKAWEARDALTDVQVTAIGKWASKGAVGKIPCSDILNKFNRNPVGFAGLLLLCAQNPLALRDIQRAYTRAFNKALFARMAEIAAWWLGLELTIATNALPKGKGTKPAELVAVEPAALVAAEPEPVAAEPEPTEPVKELSVTDNAPEATPAAVTPSPANESESTLAVLKALSAALDGLIAKVAEMDERVGDLTSRLEALANAPAASIAPSTGSTGDALAALAAKGLEVVVRPSTSTR
jgi:hypothetical protein